jgi:hypothetical protein
LAGRRQLYTKQNMAAIRSPHQLGEVEITPAMIAAGVKAYYELGEVREPEDIVELIYEAMAIAKTPRDLPTCSDVARGCR